jgi:hypothetical protein
MKPNEKWLHVYSETDTALDYTPRPSWTARLRTFLTPRKDDTHARIIAVIQRYQDAQHAQDHERGRTRD